MSFGEWRKGFTILETSKKKAALGLWLDTDLLPLFSVRILAMSQAIAERWGVLEGQRQLMGRPLHVVTGRDSSS